VAAACSTASATEPVPPRTTIAAPEIDAYAEAHTSPEPEHLRRLSEETVERTSAPGMSSGIIEGRLLELLVHVTGARNVLEVGGFTGYGTISLASALPPGGRVTSLELSAEHAAFARRHIEAAGLADRVDLIEGPALDAMQRLPGPFDLVFIDADKGGYRDYYEAAVPKLAPRGVLIADNTLWSGRVLDPREESDRVLADFNDHVAADPRTVQVLLPARDGITLVRLA